MERIYGKNKKAIYALVSIVVRVTILVIEPLKPIKREGQLIGKGLHFGKDTHTSFFNRLSKDSESTWVCRRPTMIKVTWMSIIDLLH